MVSINLGMFSKLRQWHPILQPRTPVAYRLAVKFRFRHGPFDREDCLIVTRNGFRHRSCGLRQEVPPYSVACFSHAIFMEAVDYPSGAIFIGGLVL